MGVKMDTGTGVCIGRGKYHNKSSLILFSSFFDSENYFLMAYAYYDGHHEAYFGLDCISARAWACNG
jgi:hypothetical protein